MCSRRKTTPSTIANLLVSKETFVPRRRVAAGETLSSGQRSCIVVLIPNVFGKDQGNFHHVKEHHEKNPEVIRNYKNNLSTF